METADVQVIVNQALKEYVSKEECEKSQKACKEVRCLQLDKIEGKVALMVKLGWAIMSALILLAIGAISFFVTLAQKIVESGIK